MRPLLFGMGLALLAGCRAKAPAPPPAPPPEVLTVPRASTALAIDGELDEPAWPNAVHSPPLTDAAGKQAPFADVSFVADAETLYLSVYVADADLRSQGDRVTVEVAGLTLVLAPGHAEVPAGVRVGTDVDGVVDDSATDDEEWISEVAIPRALLPAGKVPFRVLRIDGGSGERPHALAWPRAAKAVLELPPGGSGACEGRRERGEGGPFLPFP